jgi:hypothetical protein
MLQLLLLLLLDGVDHFRCLFGINFDSLGYYSLLLLAVHVLYRHTNRITHWLPRHLVAYTRTHTYEKLHFQHSSSIFHYYTHSSSHIPNSFTYESNFAFHSIGTSFSPYNVFRNLQTTPFATFRISGASK